jgi:hypothetical protein
MKIRKISQEVNEIVWLTFFTLLIYFPIYYCENYLHSNNDFAYHLYFSKMIFLNPQEIPIPVYIHAGWQWVVLLAHTILQHSWNFSSLTVTLCCVLVTSLIIFLRLKKYVQPIVAGLLAIGIQMIGPIAFLFPIDHTFSGYVWPNVFHNPTILLLKPLAILQFFYAVETIGKGYSKWRTIIVAAIVSAIAVYVKPNFVICILPAVFIIAIVNFFQRKQVDWKMLIIGLSLPSIVILGWQFIMTYVNSSDNSSIRFLPFVVMNSQSNYLLPKFFSSLVFPILVTFGFWKDAKKSIFMQLSWLAFFFGALLTYFFAETGLRLYHGNFIWSGEISIFVLFLGCILFLAEHWNNMDRPALKWFILASGFLHVYTGTAYYFSQLLFILK